MIKGQYDYIKKWQNEVFDDKKKEELLNTMLLSEIKQFSVFLYDKNIQIPASLLTEYAETRNLKI